MKRRMKPGPFAPVTAEELLPPKHDTTYGDPELKELNGIKLKETVTFEPITGAFRGIVVGLSETDVFVAVKYELGNYAAKIKGWIVFPFEYKELAVSHDKLKMDRPSTALHTEPIKVNPMFDISRAAQTALKQTA